MPQIYIDADNYNFISDPNFKSGTTAYSFKRGDKINLYVNLVSGNTVLSAVSGRSIKFGVKEKGKYDGNFVVSTSSYAISTSPFTGLASYLLEPSFNTVALNQLLSAFDNEPGNDQVFVTLMGEITTSLDGVNFDSTNTVDIIVNNDVIRGDESTPLINPSPVEWLCTNLASLSCPIASNTSISTTTGQIYSQSGSVFTTSGNISTTSGSVYAGGNIYTTSGNISAQNGSIMAKNNITVGGNILTTSTLGGIYTTGGSGDIYTTGFTADIYTTYGSINSGYKVTASGEIVSNNGPIHTVYGNIYTDNGNIGIKTTAPDRALDVNADTIKIRTNRTIALSSSTGTQGDICFDANYIYRCVATNTWKRSPLTTW